MATLIDSSVLIAAQRGQLNFDEVAASYSEEDVAISAVSASELLARRDRARTPLERRTQGLRRGSDRTASSARLRSHSGTRTRLALG
jgi:predicted nucleic acid-binding protein